MDHNIILECLIFYCQEMAVARYQENPTVIELEIRFVAAADFIKSWKEKLCCLSTGKEENGFVLLPGHNVNN